MGLSDYEFNYAPKLKLSQLNKSIDHAVQGYVWLENHYVKLWPLMLFSGIFDIDKKTKKRHWIAL